MVSRIQQIIEDVLRAEKGYVNDPTDRGGETNWGITKAVARESGYLGPMAEMPVEVARTIYENRYIVRPGFARIVPINYDIAAELVDTGVNMGPATAGMFLQRWLNAFNSERRYDDLFVDGAVGTNTINALISYLDWRGEQGAKVILRGLNGVQATRYLDIVERDRSQRRFIYGWIANRVQGEF